MMSPLADSGLGLLSVGTPRRIRPVAANVSGYAWHDSEPDLLAYTRVADGEWELWNVDSLLEPELVIRGIGIEGKVVTWGDWGYAIQEADRVRLLTPEGEFKAMAAGRALDSIPDGWVAMSDGGLKLVSSGGGVNRLDAVELGLLGEIESARFSPDGTKLVVVGGAGHLIIPLDDEEGVIHAPVTSGFPQLAWTSDSRFVISPWIRGVLIIDTERRGQSQTYLTRHVVVAVATVPLTDR